MLGTGNSMSLNVSWSEFQRAVSFNYFNPYFTLDGISRGYNVFFRQTDYEQQNLATYSTDAYGAGVNFGFPDRRDATHRLRLDGRTHEVEGGLLRGAGDHRVHSRTRATTFLNYKANLSWTSSTLNRGLFPTRGRSQTVALELSVPAAISRSTSSTTRIRSTSRSTENDDAAVAR